MTTSTSNSVKQPQLFQQFKNTYLLLHLGQSQFNFDHPKLPVPKNSLFRNVASDEPARRKLVLNRNVQVVHEDLKPIFNNAASSAAV